MAKYGTVSFTAGAETSYQFTAYSRDSEFNDVGAVYFITKRAVNSTRDGHSHSSIYVGETGNLSDRLANHHQTACFDQLGANCVCVHAESDDKKRLAIEVDLLENYNPPCNQQ